MMSTKMSPRCDICNFRDGHKGLVMVQCKVCNLCVHADCYGTVTQPEYMNDFTCLACLAVGRSFEAVETHMSSNIVTVKQRERPSQCALCSVSDGVHAMHPLYDNHGRGGRQICRSVNGDLHLVWAHSLCAYYLSLKGLVYGCLKDGSYGEVADDPEDENYQEEGDSRPPNPELVSRIEDVSEFYKSHYGMSATHHFRYYLRDPQIVDDRDLDRYTRAVEEHKKEARCTICGLDDKSDPMIMRIPVQCVANDKDEFPEFRRKHSSLQPGIPCFEALHVGCGRWGINPTNVQRVYYFPGIVDEGVNIDPVNCLFCTLHAQDVDARYQKRLHEQQIAHKGASAHQSFNPVSVIPKCNQKAVYEGLTLSRRTNPAMARIHQSGNMRLDSSAIPLRSANPVHNDVAVSDPKPSTGSFSESIGRKPPQNTLKSDPISKSVKASYSVDLSSMTAPSSTVCKKKSKNWSLHAPGVSDTAIVGSVNAQNSNMADGRTGSRGRFGTKKPRDRYAELDSTEAVAVSDGAQPTLARNRRTLANQKSIVTDTKVDQILQDLILHVEQGGEGSKEDTLLPLALVGRKRYWKHKFSELSTDDFRSVWKRANASFKKLKSNGVPQSKVAGEKISKPSKHCRTPVFDLNEESTTGNEGNSKKKIETIVSHLQANRESINNAEKPQKVGTENNDDNEKSQLPRCHDENIEGEDNNDDYASHTAGERTQMDARPVRSTSPEEIIEASSIPDPWAKLFIGPDYTGEEFKLEEEDYPDTVSI